MDEPRDFDQNDNAETPRLEEIISWLERITRRSLGDVRIHDSEQAGELARRLGARAFTAGRHIYMRPDLLRPLTRESAALLAHELYHVAEQSGEIAAPQPHAGMPLLRPSPTRARVGNSASEHMMSAPALQAPGIGTPGGALAVQRQAAQGVPIQRVETSTGGGLSGSEATAEAVASSVAQQAEPHGKKHKQAAPPDPEVIADLVYRQIAHELLLDRERGLY